MREYFTVGGEVSRKVIAIEGCFVHCAARMMEGVIPNLKYVIVQADQIYDIDLPFGIDEVPDKMFTVYAYNVAEQVVQDHVNTAQGYNQEKSGCSAGEGASKPSGGCGK